MKVRTTKSEDAAEQATALLTKLIDIARAMDDAPTSPFSLYAPASERRDLRRSAMRLRKGQLGPRYHNLFNATMLADVCERTAKRDEMFEAAYEELDRLLPEFDRIVKRNNPVVQRAILAYIGALRRASAEQGPWSDAARRYQHLWDLSQGAPQWLADRRRQKRRELVRVQNAAERRLLQSAAEILTSPPEGETVIDIPEGRDYGYGRCLQRIGMDAYSWVGSFALGDRSRDFVAMMPGDRHLFISMAGAGYIVDVKSHALVEELGQDVMDLLFADEGALCVVVHDAVLEVFTANGRLWRTPLIGAGELRHVQLTHEVFWVEARHPERPEERVWFEIDRVTGDVQFYKAPST